MTLFLTEMEKMIFRRTKYDAEMLLYFSEIINRYLENIVTPCVVENYRDGHGNGLRRVHSIRFD